MILQKPLRAVLLVTAILAAAAILVLFYIRTQGSDESDYFQNIATVRQLQQVDARWELDVMKSKIGISANYDALVDPLLELGQLQQKLRAATKHEPNEVIRSLAAADGAIADAMRRKTLLIERFKSHNAVLRNSLAFLPTAMEEARADLRAVTGHRIPVRESVGTANTLLLATLIYSQSPSEQEAAAVDATLRRLQGLANQLPEPATRDLSILAAHVRVVLREQSVVNQLLRDIAAVPTNARIGAFDRLLGTEQKRIESQAQRARQYLLIFATFLVALLVFSAVRLLRGHAEINRVNKALGEANAGLEQRVADRTRELLVTNAELREGEKQLASQARELEEARDVAEAANDAKSAFLATMSHELRTPLNAIIGFTELMQTSLFGPLGHAKYVEYIADIHKSGSHLLSLINDILDLSRLDAGRADLVDEVFSLEQLIRDVCRFLEPLARQGGLKIAAEIAPALPKLRADQRRVKQVILNLLSNAIKFTPAGGRVSVEAALGDGRLCLVVRDSGIGMTKEDLPKALERFGQVDTRLARKYEGTGLGLPLAKQLVELHDGTFEISSTPNVGTTVSIMFPPNRIVRDNQPIAKTTVGRRLENSSISAAAR